MSTDAWINLWMALLWGSAIAFFVVTVYIVIGWLSRMLRRSQDGDHAGDDG